MRGCPSIYKIENRVNGKVYVGSTLNHKSRFSGHRSLLSRNKHSSIHLQSAWNKYGGSCFVFSLLETFDDNTELSDIRKREDFWIIHYRAADREFGYNINETATLKRFSEETKVRMRGKKKPADFGEKISKRDGFFLKYGRMEMLLKLRSDGLSCPQIAKIFGCDRHTVSKALSAKQMYAKNINDPIPKDFKTDGQYKPLVNETVAAKIILYRLMGASTEFIGKKLNCKKTTIQNIAARRITTYDYNKIESMARDMIPVIFDDILDINFSKRKSHGRVKLTYEQAAIVIGMLKLGKSSSYIANYFNCNKSVIRAIKEKKISFYDYDKLEKMAA